MMRSVVFWMCLASLLALLTACPSPAPSIGSEDGGTADGSTTPVGPAEGGPDGGQGDSSMPTMPACGSFGQACCAGGTCDSSNLSCIGGTCGQARTGETGKPCSRNGDCQSGICLPIGNGTNVCTTSCSVPSDCVAGWSCGALIGQPSNVCQCKAAAEVCNAKDDDCDGIVDNEPQVDNACVASRGGGYVCANGQCSCAPENLCGGVCVDTSNDSRNCGHCGNVCPNGGACTGGQCACSGGESVCGSACVNESNDVNHCGSCTNVCAAGASCVAGQCNCPGDPLVCSGTCVAVSTTEHDCNGTCASNTSVQTCGTSCAPCPTDPNGTASCDGHTCSLMCNPGYVPCSGGCCQNCATAGCTGLTWCDPSSGLCQPGCAFQSQCDATQGLFCDVVTHACEITVMTNSCPAGWTYLGQCSDGTEYCANPNLPGGTTYVFNMSCPAGSTARGGYYCSGPTNCCVPDS